MLDLRQTPEYAKYMDSIGWIVDGKPGSYAYIKRIPIIGNFVKIQHPQKMDKETIKGLIRKFKPSQIVAEPGTEIQIFVLRDFGFKQTKTYFIPTKTVQVDLKKSETKLLLEMHYKTRYNIKMAVHNSKLTINKIKDIEYFADFWQRCAFTQRNMYLSQKKEIVSIYKAFKNNAHIVTIYEDGRLASGILMICTKDIAYYMYAASTPRGKKVFAPTLNAWEAIKLARRLNKKAFDFEGIYDERFPIKSWLGFTRFKKSFGGVTKNYPGTFTKLRFPI